MILMEHVSCAYGKDVKILDDISLMLKEGEQVALIGANGAGKSTLMKTILGLLPFEGNIIVDGNDVEKNNLQKIRKCIGYVLQDSDNQMFMPTVLEDMIFGPVNYGLKKEDAIKKAEEILSKMELLHLENRQNYKMSGGEKRMAAIATILAMQPKVMLMDEPSTALDPRNRRRLIELLKELPVTKLIATHDLDLVLETCDRVILLSDGKIAADGGVKEILTDKELLEAHHLELPLCLAGIPKGFC